MSDLTARPLDPPPGGRLLDAQGSFGRGRDDGRGFYGMLGESDAMRALFRAVERLAPHARATLITGAAGSGKRLLASVAHRLGPCRGGAQLRLLGADDAVEREQLREAARGSRAAMTAFVPELGDLSADHQAELVRALAASADLPVGEGLHVIAATSRHVPTEMAIGRLRTDLYVRLAAVPYHLPALDQRRDDIPVLAPALLRDACRRLKTPDRQLAGAALRVLDEHVWTGHVRELAHVLLRAAALADDAVIGAQTMREACGPAIDPSPVPRVERRNTGLAPADRARVTAALAATAGNKSAAAAHLGISRRAFYRLLERLDA
jgi:DNA-binding NtrC family response regulator